jgi:glycosyltransferase involved in cell wall biosynthesis
MVDLRDPWSGLERLPDDHASPLYFTLLKRHERVFVRDARLIVMNTDRARDDMRRRYPAAADRIVVVRNGSDDEALPSVTPSERFTIRFAGSLCLDRDPTTFFRAASRVVRHLGLTPADFAIEFIGTVEEIGGRTVRKIAAAEGVAEFLELGGSMPRDDAMRFLAGATVLLNLPQDSDLCVPAKIFEYVRFNAWILVLASDASATADTLRGTTADIVDPNDVDAMATVIERRYTQHARGERPVAIGQDGRFDRAHQARLLLDYVGAIVGQSTPDDSAPIKSQVALTPTGGAIS